MRNPVNRQNVEKKLKSTSTFSTFCFGKIEKIEKKLKPFFNIFGEQKPCFY